MSIEHEKIDGENTENTLEQYGVWVKKSPADNSVDDITQPIETGFGDDFDLDENDFDTDSLEIFSDEEKIDEDIGINFGDNVTLQEDSIEDDADDTTLTTDELLNITSGMSIDDEDKVSDSDLDIDFDSFVDIDESVSLSDTTEETISETQDSIDADLNSDFDLMGEDSSQSVSSINIEEDLSVFDDSSDMDISFDDFMNEEAVAQESEDDTTLDMDVSFDETSDSIGESDSLDASDFEMDIEENTPISLGEEISLDDIPSSDETAFFADTISDQEDKQDFNIAIETEQKESVQNIAQNSDSNSMLSKIVEELSSLRQEMSQFKSELAKIKTDGSGAQPRADAPNESGFFSDYEGDDTIALSGDELNNILTSADFTIDDEEGKDTSEDETSEVPVSESSSPEIEIESEIDDDFSMDSLDEDYFLNTDDTLVLEDKELVEPSLDDIDFDIDTEDSLPDEIDVPVIENLVVDSSPVNFFDDEENQEEISDASMQHLQEDPDDQEIIDEIDEELSDDIEDSDLVASFSEHDINDPVSSVFSSDQWDTDIEEDSDVDGSEKGGLGGTMQEEIKSVLSYMDRLLESLPEDKISEFAQSEYFDRYKKLFTDLGIA